MPPRTTRWKICAAAILATANPLQAQLVDETQVEPPVPLGTIEIADDTASNLNPGDRNGNPQDPANLGNINLGALFQIPDPDGLGE